MTVPPAGPHLSSTLRHSRTWPCEPETARRARDVVSALLNGWGLGDLVDRGVLVVSELVGNSVQHAGCRLVRVSVSRIDGNTVCISVSDKSKTPPVCQIPEEDAEAGRGLQLVDALADRWETAVRDWGKVVRAELDAKPDDL